MTRATKSDHRPAVHSIGCMKFVMAATAGGPETIKLFQVDEAGAITLEAQTDMAFRRVIQVTRDGDRLMAVIQSLSGASARLIEIPLDGSLILQTRERGTIRLRVKRRRSSYGRRAARQSVAAHRTRKMAVARRVA